VRRVLELLGTEFGHTLALCGGRIPADLTRDMVVTRGHPAGPAGTGGMSW
jgi:4-hydroxymandelate oxidase